MWWVLMMLQVSHLLRVNVNSAKIISWLEIGGFYFENYDTKWQTSRDKVK